MRALRSLLQVLLLHQRLLKEHPGYDYYVWMDGDAAFIDHSLDIRMLPEMHPGQQAAGQESAAGAWQQLLCLRFPSCWRACPAASAAPTTRRLDHLHVGGLVARLPAAQGEHWRYGVREFSETSRAA
jgi:hypothetical protein